MKDIIRHILKEDKKERFLQFVINDLIADTIIDYDKDSIYFYVDHMPLPLSIFYTELTKQYSKFLDRPLPSFSDYCKERYGLTEDEIKYVWDQYKSIIKDKITNKDNINESIEDKKSRFLNYVIDDLVSKTIIEYENVTFTDWVSYPLNYRKFFKWFYPATFTALTIKRYGLTKEEIIYVWYQYKSIIKDKITSK